MNNESIEDLVLKFQKLGSELREIKKNPQTPANPREWECTSGRREILDIIINQKGGDFQITENGITETAAELRQKAQAITVFLPT